MVEIIEVFCCFVVSILYFNYMRANASMESISHIHDLYQRDLEYEWQKYVDGKVTLEEYYEFKMMASRAENIFIQTRYS